MATTMQILKRHPLGRIVLLGLLGAMLLTATSLGACALFRKSWPTYQAYATESGVWIKDLTVTNGRAVTGNETIEIHYDLTLEDGTQIDSTLLRGQPVEYSLGVGGGLPLGLEEGLVGMRELGRRMIKVPPELGFGRDGIPELGVPPDAQLVFDVELLRIVLPAAE